MNYRYIIPLVLAFFIFLTGCEYDNLYPDRYFDYSGNDGCSPPNIGHGLGGDLAGHGRNTLEGMRAISESQSSECFKNWEADLNQTSDSIVLSHDPTLRGFELETLSFSDISEELPALELFAKEIVKLDLRKPVILDIKNVSNSGLWPVMRKAARTIREEGNIPAWFIIDKDNAEDHEGLCSCLGKEFDVMLYRRGGPLCV